MSNRVKLENVLSVYVGRNGACCCGCSGKHSYASAYRAIASKRRGYPVRDEEISDVAVKRAFNRILRNLSIKIEDDHMYAVEGSRLVVAYFK